jgi:DNA-binding NarL/FixJ family response regulator
MNQHPLAAAILEEVPSNSAAGTVAIVGDRQLNVAALTALLVRHSEFRLIAEARGTAQVHDALAVHQPAVVVEARNDAGQAPLELGRTTMPSTDIGGIDSKPDGFTSAVTAAVGEASQRAAVLTGRPEDRLTERERTILTRVASGQSVKQVARECSIAPKTVGNHVNKICRKLNLRSRGQLVLFALQQGLTRA